MYNDRTFPAHIISANICKYGVYICSCSCIALVCLSRFTYRSQSPKIISIGQSPSQIALPPLLGLALQIPTSMTAKKGKGKKGKNLKNPPMGAQRTE